jgi:hypothetical protein
LVVVTDWGVAAVGPLLALNAAIAAAALAYLYVLRRDRPPSLLWTAIASAAGMAIAWFAPVLFSSDVYAYAAYGELANIGINPYAHPVAGIADPVVRAAQLQWVSAFPICVYGPAFVAFSRALMTAFAPLGFHVQLDAFRAAACLSLLVCVGLAPWCYPGDLTQRLRAAAALGLNPVAIWSAVEGHNDALALAVVFAGYAVARRSPAAGAAIAGLTGLIKAPAAVAALAYGLSHRRALFGALAGIAIAAAGSIPLLVGIASEIAPHGHYAPAASVQAVFAPLGAPFALVLALTIAAVLAIRGLALVRSNENEGWIWLAIAAWVLVPNPYPWYSIWLVAIAAMSLRSRAASAAVALSLTSTLRYIPDAVGQLTIPFSIALAILASLPIAALIPRAMVREYNERPV